MINYPDRFFAFRIMNSRNICQKYELQPGIGLQEPKKINDGIPAGFKGQQSKRLGNISYITLKFFFNTIEQFYVGYLSHYCIQYEAN